MQNDSTGKLYPLALASKKVKHLASNVPGSPRIFFCRFLSYGVFAEISSIFCHFLRISAWQANAPGKQKAPGSQAPINDHPVGDCARVFLSDPGPIIVYSFH